jgi:hypothetical protein
VTPLPAFVSYEFADRKELCLALDAPSGRNVMLVPPLFDEMNRMRKMLVDVMRALQTVDISSFLPDLPGCNESPVPLAQVTLTDWQHAVQACAQQHRISHIASFRAGVLTVAAMPDAGHWMLSPVKGAAILRTMMRTRIAADRETGLNTSLSGLAEQAKAEPIELAGNIIGPALFSQLNDAKPPTPKHQRIARLASDNKPADVQIDGSALWLRAEPGDDPAMSCAIAKDIAAWVGQ